MKYHELQVESNKDRKRVGRGIGAGQGKTAGRGTKGQSSRTGKKLGHGFMGGQGPLVRRIPKNRGFKSLRVPAQVVYLDQLNSVKGTTIDNFTLAEAGLVATPHHTVKVIARGEYTGKATVKVQAASASVVAAIEKAGGKFEATPTPLRESTNVKKADKRARKATKEAEK
jgi:large subunit ribosomal protein L15